MTEQDTQPSSQTFRLVSSLITGFCLAVSIFIALKIFPAKEALIGVGGGYLVIATMMAGISKFPSSSGAVMDTPIGVPVQWRLVFMISAIFTFIFASFIGVGELFVP